MRKWTLIRCMPLGMACVGIALAVLLFVGTRPAIPMRSIHLRSSNSHSASLQSYPEWLRKLGITRTRSNKPLVTDDKLTRQQPSLTESNFLRMKAPILCAVMKTNEKNVKAIDATWSLSCDKVIYYEDPGRKRVGIRSSMKSQPKSSFLVLCELLGNIGRNHPRIDWTLFVRDDMFVIPENLRYLVAPLNASEEYYLGHAVNFWGVDYNTASAGFVLSRGAIDRLIEKFPDSDTCATGGKYWKQEDLYLGKHLASMNIFPSDTRDENNMSVFLGFDLEKMIFPNSIRQFSNYYTRSIYPVKCCGDKTITFQVLSSTEMYKYKYMIYALTTSNNGISRNQPASTVTPDDYVWKEYVMKKGLPMNISDKDYEKSWYQTFGNATVIPGMGKDFYDRTDVDQKFRYPADSFDVTNMPEVLADMLSNYSSSRF